MPAVKDTRWPYLPKLGLRIAQIVFALIVLGIYADLESYVSGSYQSGDNGLWWIGFGLTTSILALIASVFMLVTFLVSTICSPLIALILDAILVVFWFISLVGTGAAEGGVLGESCSYRYTSYYTGTTYSGTSTICQLVKAGFAIVFISFLLFIGSLVLSALMFHRYRKTGGAMTETPGIMTATPVVPVPPAAPGVTYGAQQPMMMNNQQPMMTQGQQYDQQQQQQHQQLQQPYGSHPQFVSPVASPAPNYEQQQYHMETNNQQPTYGMPVKSETYQPTQNAHQMP